MAKEKGITSIIFDRGGFQYQGMIASVADGAREAGLYSNLTHTNI